MVIWSEYLSRIADFTNTTTTQAGIIHALMITVIVLLIVVIATKGKSATISIPIVALLCILMFTYMEWFPFWTGSVIALVLVIFLGLVFSGSMGR